jgi:hypothetical protein
MAFVTRYKILETALKEIVAEANKEYKDDRHGTDYLWQLMNVRDIARGALMDAEQIRTEN